MTFFAVPDFKILDKLPELLMENILILTSKPFVFHRNFLDDSLFM